MQAGCSPYLRMVLRAECSQLVCLSAAVSPLHARAVMDAYEKTTQECDMQVDEM